MKYLLVLIFIINLPLYSQDDKINSCLELIKAGDIEKARAVFEELSENYGRHPELIYLDAKMTSDGFDALEKYEKFYSRSEGSKYAADALYQISSYYYAAGIYDKADEYRKTLKEKFPEFEAGTSITSTAVKQKVNEERKELPEEYYPEKYTVQAGAFSEHGKAAGLAELLKNEKPKPRIVDKTVNGKKFRVVILGEFENKEAAETLARKVSKKYQINPIVQKYPFNQ